MKYYQANLSTDIKVIGAYPQCSGIPNISGFDIDSLDSDLNSMIYLKNTEFPSIVPKIAFELSPKAILTDALHQILISSKGMLISNRLKAILKKYTSLPHSFYPAEIHYNNSKFEYFWYHPVVTSLDFIDYENSEFYLASITRMRKGKIEISSEKDFFDKRKSFKSPNKNILSSKIRILKEKARDIMFIPYINNRIHFSGVLRDEIQASNITGFDFSKEFTLEV